MARSLRLGHRVRRLRREHGLTQAAMAKSLGISASYLNLIEHNRRPLTAPLLLELARVYDVELAALSEDDEARLHDDLMETFGDELFAEAELKAADVQALLDASPEVARGVLTLYRAYLTARAERRALVERVTDIDAALESDPARLPSEEVSDFLQEHRNHFPALEDGADDLRESAGEDPGALLTGLTNHLLRRHGVAVEVVPADAARGVMRMFDPDRKRLVLSEVLAPRSRLFQLAHQLALLEQGDTLDQIVSHSATLVSSDGRALARVALASYVAGAVLMPYEPFVQAARSLRYDIEVLGHRFRTSFEQVCHRLTTLGRPGDEGVPFHMVRVDIAGNISKRFSASGIRFARYSGACPLWNVHAALMQPGFIRTQLSTMPDGETFFCIARTIRREGGSFRVPQSRLAIGLGCEVAHARELVYADGVDLKNTEAAVPIGPTCRLCERSDCRQRAFPPLQQRLNVDENVRGLSFYQAPAVPRGLT
jgi:predicted transcriptional regulator/DNA-binding XRE family transcriptional regulator